MNFKILLFFSRSHCFWIQIMPLVWGLMIQHIVCGPMHHLWAWRKCIISAFQVIHVYIKVWKECYRSRLWYFPFCKIMSLAVILLDGLNCEYKSPSPSIPAAITATVTPHRDASMFSDGVTSKHLHNQIRIILYLVLQFYFFFYFTLI